MSLLVLSPVSLVPERSMGLQLLDIHRRKIWNMLCRKSANCHDQLRDGPLQSNLPLDIPRRNSTQARL